MAGRHPIADLIKHWDPDRVNALLAERNALKAEGLALLQSPLSHDLEDLSEGEGDSRVPPKD